MWLVRAAGSAMVLEAMRVRRPRSLSGAAYQRARVRQASRDRQGPAGPSVNDGSAGRDGLLPCQLIVKESRLNRSPLPPLKTKYSLCVPPGSVTGVLTVV